ncbi:MAG: hypothetical protein IJ220_01185 [Clostridia bacterium]|nr:hypothetical protein [Clostridia bacterium]
MEKIKESIKIILKSNVYYQFRTTVYPKYVSAQNVERIAKYLKQVGAKEYMLQNYFDYDNKVKPYSPKELEEMAEKCKVYIPTTIAGII